MIPSFENIDFTQYSVDDRLALIGRIWDSIDSGPVELTPEQTSELDRRVAVESATGDAGITWADLKRRVQESP